MNNKIVTAKFIGDNYANVFDIYQWDYGQILRIEGLKLPKMVEIHFSLEETSGEALVRIGTTKDGVTDVIIPDSMMENEGAGNTYCIFAWVYIADKDSGSTEYKIVMHVKGRAKPEIPHGGGDGDAFREAVEMVKESAEKAEEAQKQAEGYAHGREDLPERAEDNAMYYARKASEDAQRTAEDRTEVERLTESNAKMQGEVKKDLEEVKKISSQAQTSATNAALSEQKSEEAATRAETAQTGAETAEGNAELAAQKTGQDKTTVEQAKKLVEQIGQEVLGNKDAVDKTTQDFALTAQRALADVNNAGQIQTERVQTAGTNAVEGVKTAQNTATKAVEDKGKEVLQSLPDLETQIDAKLDKNQGAEHTGKALVVGEDGNVVPGKLQTEGVGDAADAIINTATGNLLLIKDSAERKNKGFGMAGKTEQASTTGKNLFDIPDIDANMQEKEVKIECNITQTITISVQKEPTTSSSIWRFRAKYKDGKLRYLNDGEFPNTFDATEENPIIEITYRKIYITSGAYTGIMVEYGTTATEYEPYTGGRPSPSPEYPQEIINCGEWREDIQKYAVDIIMCNAGYLQKGTYYDDIKGFPLEKGKTYRIFVKHNSAVVNGCIVYGEKEFNVSTDMYHYNRNNGLTVPNTNIINGECKIPDNLSKGYVFTVETDGLFLYHGVNNTSLNTEDAYIVYDFIEKMNMNEPYKEQTLTLTSDRPITKWDRLVEQDGQIGWLYKSSTITFDGKLEENWKVYNNKSFSIEIADANFQKSLCDKYKHKAGAWSEPDFCIYSDNGYPQKYFVPPYEEFEMNVDTWKTFLNKNPLTVVYETLTTEFVPLPQEQQDAIRALSTYYPTTVVINSEDMEMELSYIADTKNFILGIAENFAQKQLETNRLILERTI